VCRDPLATNIVIQSTHRTSRARRYILQVTRTGNIRLGSRRAV
jgi:hypothetical protein